jgi:pheromone shutdown protein TraB
MSTLPSLLVAASLGAMLFFTAVIAPMVFRVVPAEHAGHFLRAFFPQYFLVNGVLAAAAGILAAHGLVTPILMTAAAAMLVVYFGAIPVINRARDKMASGDVAAKQTFDAWHRGTVITNAFEMGLLIAALLLLSR